MRTPAQLETELLAREHGLRAQRTLVSVRVTHFGRHLHQRLGSVGLLGAGFAAGVLLDRLRPTREGVRAGSALVVAALKLSPVMGMLGEQLRHWFGRSE